jgi:UDP-N-acetylmuramyl pentapeptide synthase
MIRISKKMAIDKKNGRRAVTHYRVLENFKQHTFGVGQGDIHAENIVLQPLSCAFDLVRGGERAAVLLPVPE